MESIICVSQSRLWSSSLVPTTITDQKIYDTDFSNILSKSAIERLAEVDEYEVVREVQVDSHFIEILTCALMCILRNISQITRRYYLHYSRLTMCRQRLRLCTAQHQMLGMSMR